MKKDKSKLLITIITIVAILNIAIYNIIDNNSCEKELSKKDKRVIVEKYYVNYEENTQIKEVIIFNDGTIYSWSKGKETPEGNINTEEGLRNILLKNGKKEKEKVLKGDLEKIKKYISYIDNSISPEYAGAGSGTSGIAVWQESKKTDIKVTGDSIGENKNKKTEKLLKIIDKYLNNYLSTHFKN